MKLSKDPFFISTFVIGSIITIGSAIAIGFSGIGELGVCFKPECFTNFLTYYAFPFKAATATAAILGIVAMLHKSKQTAEQIALSTQQIQTTINQNQYLNYFSHLKDFKEQINGLDLTILKPEPNNNAYKLIFPNNAPSNFSPNGTCDGLLNSLKRLTDELAKAEEKYCKNYPDLFSKDYTRQAETKDIPLLVQYHNDILGKFVILTKILGIRTKVNYEVILNSRLLPKDIKDKIYTSSKNLELPPLGFYEELYDEIVTITNKLMETSLEKNLDAEAYAMRLFVIQVTLLATLHSYNKSIREWTDDLTTIF
ncbi:hypothetical protein [Photobacterium leiognathi]|uniref:hypothetical protein n=1 Tax=Photobacterium leiognathi TaxID=553611 RepID=UPI0029825961|nr:hypothetical protein [Photobacterium leiognathi]